MFCLPSWTKLRSESFLQTLRCSMPGSYHTSSRCTLPCPHSTNQLASSCIHSKEVLKEADGVWSRRAEPCHRSTSTMTKCRLCASFQTLSQSFRNIFIVLFSPVHWGGLRSGGVKDWHPCRADTSETRSGEIWDDLPKQRGTLPPPCLLCLPIITPNSLPVRKRHVKINY